MFKWEVGPMRDVKRLVRVEYASGVPYKLTVQVYLLSCGHEAKGASDRRRVACRVCGQGSRP